MKKQMSHILVILAIFNLALSPSKVIAETLPDTFPSSHNFGDPQDEITKVTETNYRRCIYIAWAGIWWCFSWGE